MKMHYGQPSYILANSDVEVRVTQLGGMVTATFRHEGREISPFFIAPWWNEAPQEDGLMQALRGNFFCLPFGTHAMTPDGKQYPTHGEPANELWDKLSMTDNKLRMKLDLKMDKGSVEKVVEIRENHPVIYETNIVRDFTGDFPMGYHPTLQLTKRVNSCILDMTPPAAGRTYAWNTERPEDGGYAQLKTNMPIDDFSKVPTIFDGVTVDMTRPPHAKGFEDIAMVLSDTSKEFCFNAVTVPDENYVYFQLKNPRELTGTLLWCSNQGRHYAPWNGRVFGCMGVEEITSFFCLGLEHAKDNDLAKAGYQTYVPFNGGEKSFSIICGAVSVPDGFKGVKDIVRGAPGCVDILGKGGEKISVCCDTGWLK